jgi:hypothetical protein
MTPTDRKDERPTLLLEFATTEDRQLFFNKLAFEMKGMECPEADRPAGCYVESWRMGK